MSFLPYLACYHPPIDPMIGALLIHTLLADLLLKDVEAASVDPIQAYPG